MSPRTTLISWGSSSIDVLRMILPIQVRRSSPSTPPGAEPSVSSKAAAFGSSGRMLRNFRQSNTFPSRPMRGCAKKIGPGELSRTSNIRVRKIGEIASSPNPAATRSPVCLMANCHPLGSVGVSTSSGTPPRCSTKALPPTASISRGTTRTRMPRLWAAWAVRASSSSDIADGATISSVALLVRAAISRLSRAPR